MNVFAVGCEKRPSTDQAAEQRKRRLKDGKPERNNRYGDGNDGRSFLRTFQCKRAQQKSYEQASAISQEDCRRVEVVTEKTKDRSGQGDRHQSNQGRLAQQGNYKND